MKVLIFLGDIIFNADNKPIGNAVRKINTWIEAGVDVQYLTKRHGFMDLKALKDSCKSNGLNTEHIHARLGDMSFVKMVEDIKPTVLIETKDSSGKEKSVSERLGADSKVKSIILEAGAGLSILDDNPEELLIEDEKEESEA